MANNFTEVSSLGLRGQMGRMEFVSRPSRNVSLAQIPTQRSLSPTLCPGGFFRVICEWGIQEEVQFQRLTFLE